MKKIILPFIFLLLSFVAGAQVKLSPVEVLSKTVDLINNGKGIEAGFSINGEGYNGSGLIKTDGTKFSVNFPDLKVWYNGKDLYTYNDNTGETTVVNPTSEELMESNPLSYVVSAQKNYNVVFSTVKKEGRYVLELQPRNKGEIKRITLTVRKTDYIPEKIVVEPSSGSPITAEIKGFKKGLTFNNSDFEYPKARYPKAEIIDLR